MKHEVCVSTECMLYSSSLVFVFLYCCISSVTEMNFKCVVMKSYSPLVSYICNSIKHDRTINYKPIF